MTSTNIFDAANKITETLGGLSESEIKKVLLMTLIAIDKEGTLVDPDNISLRTATVPQCVD